MAGLPIPHIRARSNPLLDAVTVLIGPVAAGADHPVAEQRASGTEVLLSTKLDAAVRFSLICCYSGHDQAVTVDLQLAPQRIDGSLGSYQSAATVSLPAEGGRVEAFISGHDLQIDAADADQVQWPCMAAAAGARWRRTICSSWCRWCMPTAGGSRCRAVDRPWRDWIAR